MVFWQPMWRLLVSKDVLLSYHWNSRDIFFLMARQHDELSLARLLYIFSLLFSKITLVIQKFRGVLLITDISTSVLILLVSKFFFNFLYNFYLFLILSFNHSLWYIYIYIYCTHSFDSFIKMIFLFNFTI
jgi:hypothetical protein